jgi:hypothetical protein
VFKCDIIVPVSHGGGGRFPENQGLDVRGAAGTNSHYDLQLAGLGSWR